ncbi:MAG: hypothetical protein K9G65_05795 [Rickettsiaceae bacterium]|nr:hypothetical protein [Rickettsiaceae bacterium]
MFGSFLANIGSGLGKYFGGGILSTIGRYGGRLLGDYLDSQWLHRTKTVHKFTNVKDSFSICTAKYGSPIPLVFGRMRVPGQIIWADRITEKPHTSSTYSHFKNKHLTNLNILLALPWRFVKERFWILAEYGIAMNYSTLADIILGCIMEMKNNFLIH